MPEKEQIFIGPHIPKCAGINFTEAVRNQIGSKHCICDSFLKRFHLEDDRFPEERESLAHIKVIFGHAVDQFTVRHAIQTKKTILFTFIRHPIDRIISFYAFTRRHREERRLPAVDFDSFYKELTHNSMCKWLTDRFSYFAGKQCLPLSEQAAMVLKSFQYVCSTETLDKYGQQIYNAIGMKYQKNIRHNCSPPNEVNKLKNEIDIAKLITDNKEDLLLYKRYTSGLAFNTHNPFIYDKNHFEQSISLLLEDVTPIKNIWRSRFEYLTDNLHLNNLTANAKKYAQKRLERAQILLEVLEKDHDPSRFNLNQRLPASDGRSEQ